ncbi:MAG: cation transporter, partial [Pseudomonadota bacterium]|nr:cation transporter [Pseudomonadota bacterium]
AQISFGFLGHSQGLIADGLHSISDLLSDFVVLFANRHGNRSADKGHPYGHGRIETAATVLLSLMLILVGSGLLWRAIFYLQNSSKLPKVLPITLAIAILAIFCKETLYHYMVRIARSVRSQLLMANAWHARSDAASSLVVTLGLIGNLEGYRFFDPVAAIIVAFLIIRMGWSLGYQALSELVDTALDEESVAAIRQTLMNTPGVRDVHELRTRRMANQALIDAHVLVAPRISVSEGHFIAELARHRVLANHNALDVLVHIDPEDDKLNPTTTQLPLREELIQFINENTGLNLTSKDIMLHYLKGQIEAVINLDSEQASQQAQTIRQVLMQRPEIGIVSLRTKVAL